MNEVDLDMSISSLTNAPPTFQSLMNDILREFINKFAMVYLDDILIFSQFETEHKDHVRRALAKLQEAQLIINPEKCNV